MSTHQGARHPGTPTRHWVTRPRKTHSRRWRRNVHSRVWTTKSGVRLLSRLARLRRRSEPFGLVAVWASGRSGLRSKDVVGARPVPDSNRVGVALPVSLGAMSATGCASQTRAWSSRGAPRHRTAERRRFRERAVGSATGPAQPRPWVVRPTPDRRTMGVGRRSSVPLRMRLPMRAPHRRCIPTTRGTPG